MKRRAGFGPRLSALLLGGLTAAAGLPGGASALGSPQPAAPQTYVVIVAGIGGEKQYADEFYETGAKMKDAAVQAGVPAANVTFLAEDPARDPRRIDGRSTRDRVASALGGVAARVGADDRLLVLLVGHGSLSGDEARFNLPGPDLGPADFARLLAPAKGRVAFVDASSASGDFLKPMAAKGRVVVTATRSGLQNNRAVFGRYFVDAFADGSGDTDKDGRVSVLEAFAFAQSEVKRRYESQNAMQTEQAQIDDESVARTFVLGRWAGEAVAASSPAAAALLREKRDTEERIAALKARKASLPAADYDAQLERLLVELATTNAALRKAAGAKP